MTGPGTVLAGAATVVVDVPPGTPMAGFAARTSPSRGVHDPLTVRALLLDHVALVSVDVCVLHEATCETIRGRVTDIAPTCVVAATHTHSGPCVGLGRVGRHAPGVHDAIVTAAEQAIRGAEAMQRECTVEFGEAFGLGVAKNRRRPERPIDPALQVLQWRSADSGEVVAHLVQYPCHPVVLDAANVLISADYPGFLRRDVEAEHPGSVCLFFTGAAGDVNTGHSAEASYTASGGRTRTYSEAERVGRMLATAATTARFLPLNDDVHPRAIHRTVDLELEDVDVTAVQRERGEWAEELRHAPADRAELLRTWIAWADDLAGGSEMHSWTASVSAIRMGEVTVVTLPGEPFLGCAEEVQARSSGPTITIGYSDGCPGYFPLREEYAHGGYEVRDAHRYYGMPAPFAAGSAERLVSVASGLVEELCAR